jgi:hypothetical protein
MFDVARALNPRESIQCRFEAIFLDHVASIVPQYNPDVVHEAYYTGGQDYVNVHGVWYVAPLYDWGTFGSRTDANERRDGF